MQELWNLLLVLAALTTAAPQEGLCGILVVTIIHALSLSGEAEHTSVAEAAHSIFTERLQSPSLAPLLPRVLPRLTDKEKKDLREGLQRVSAMRAGRASVQSRLGVGTVSGSKAPQAPRIDFAAFQCT